ncbi:MAG: DUF1801 domain-containing protein [Daejeonella sp.]
MNTKSLNQNPEVSLFLDQLKHPLREEIEILRDEILRANSLISENIKWNGPNYSVHGTDCISMKIQPPKQIQLIFHRGAKVKEMPSEKLIDDPTKWLVFKTNDRAVLSFSGKDDLLAKKDHLKPLINDWIHAVLDKEE